MSGDAYIPYSQFLFNNQVFNPNGNYVFNNNFITPMLTTQQEVIRFGFNDVVRPLIDEIDFKTYAGRKDTLIYTEASRVGQKLVDDTNLDFIGDKKLAEDIKNYLSNTTANIIDNTLFMADKYLPNLTKILRPEIVNLPIKEWVESMDKNADGKVSDAEIAKGLASALIDEVLPDNITDINEFSKDSQDKLVSLFKTILGIKTDANRILDTINIEAEGSKQQAQIAYMFQKISEGVDDHQEIIQGANKVDENFLEQVDPKYLPENFDITQLSDAEREKLDILIDYFFGEESSIEEALKDVKEAVGESYYNGITVGRAINIINAGYSVMTSKEGEKLLNGIVDLAGNFDAKDPDTWRKLSETITNLQEAKDSGVDTKTIIEEASKVLESLEDIPEWLTKEALMLLSGDIEDEGSAKHLIHGIAKFIDEECDIPWTIVEGTLKWLAGGTSREGLKRAIEHVPNRVIHVLENKNAYIFGGGMLALGALAAFPLLTLGAATVTTVAWFWDDITGWVEDKWNKATDWVEDKWNKATNFVEDTWDTICSWF